MARLRCEALTARGKDCARVAKWYVIPLSWAATDTCLPAVTLVAWCPTHRDYEKARAQPVVMGGLPFELEQQCSSWTKKKKKGS